jgi:pimeloyl-ACP methyl ester carboxylesterase
VSAVVVYVHGLWLSGRESVWLRRRLSSELGAEARAFTYPSVRAKITDNAIALGRQLAAIRTDTLHLVGHSLGGLVILKLFELSHPVHGLLGDGWALPPGRVVLLGSPVRGSRSAQRLSRLPFGKNIMGVTVREALLTPSARHWDGARDLGIIAGNLGLGLGRLLGRMGAPNDGTVLVEETRLADATAHLTLRVSHSGMVFSAVVAERTAAFLRDGRFEG